VSFEVVDVERILASPVFGFQVPSYKTGRQAFDESEARQGSA
jgi:hypothetical protein